MSQQSENEKPAEASSGDFRIDLAKEIARQLPVREFYQDGMSPPVKEIGRIAENLLKTVHLVLFPIQVGAVVQDRFSSFIRKAAERVPREDRIEPAPQVLGPILEAIKFEPEGTSLDKMYSELLSRAFDKERAGEAHGAYAKIIGQMSGEEALFLEHIDQHSSMLEEDLRDGTISDGEFIENERWTGSGIKGNRFAMASHLVALGLLEWISIQPSRSFSRVRELEELVNEMRHMADLGPVRQIEVSPFGEAFLSAVTKRSIHIVE